MKLRRGLSMLLAAFLLLLSAAALAECTDTFWDVERTRHRLVCRGKNCDVHKSPTYITKWQDHSLYLTGYKWPDKVEMTNGKMPEEVTVIHSSIIQLRCEVCGKLEDHYPTGSSERARLESSTPVTCTSKGYYTYASAGLTSANPDAYLYGHKLYSKKTYTVNALGHDWSGKDGQCAREGCSATCSHEEAQGRLTCTAGTTCATCGKALSPLGHDWSGKDGQCAREGCSATCTHEESQKQVTCAAGVDCAVCGKALSALGHDWSGKDGHCAREGCDEACAHEEAQDRLTCTEGTTCATCGKALSALGHDWSGKDGRCAREDCDEACMHEESQKQVTCTAGVDCAVCGKALSALGHDYQTENVKPTCEKKGFVRYTCARCGDTYKETTAKKLSHWFGEWAPNADETHSASCRRDGCSHVGQVSCQKQAYSLKMDGQESTCEISLCPVCGELADGLRLELVEGASALAVSEELPAGEMVLRLGEAKDGAVLMSVAFEYGGSLVQPQGQVQITLPASVTEGYAMMLVDEAGAETELAVESDEDTCSFLLDYATMEGEAPSPVCLIRLVAHS